MRLGQLARQLDIKTDEIVAFLASRQIVVDPGNNTKLEDEHAALVVNHFAPEQNVALSPPVVSTPVISEVQQEEPVETDSDPAEAETPELPDLIKAPKVELPGLKVLGKIELPEKKKKEPEGEPAQETAQPPDSESVIPKPEPPARRPRQEDRPRRESRPWRNPLEEQRRREEREKKRKLEEERQAAKQRKAEYYKKRLKPQPPTKAVRLTHQEEMEEMPALEAPRPRTWLGRFMAWLNGR